MFGGAIPTKYDTSFQFIGFGSEVSYMTLVKMKQIIADSSKNPYIVQVARAIVRYVPEKNYEAEAKRIYNWVRTHTKYVRDPEGTETLTTPPMALDIIKSGGVFEGDCDDLTVLTLTLLKAIGFPVKLVAAGYNEKDYSHVYGAVLLGRNWVPIEPIKRGVELGWEAPNATKKMKLRV